jgi:hypothetical protein
MDKNGKSMSNKVDKKVAKQNNELILIHEEF